MLGNIAKHPLRSEKNLSVDKRDNVILETINSSKNLGTLQLSRNLKVAPKNLISRLNKLERLGLISKDKVSRKPKGWNRVWKVTEEGDKMIKSYNSLIKLVIKLDSSSYKGGASIDSGRDLKAYFNTSLHDKHPPTNNYCGRSRTSPLYTYTVVNRQSKNQLLEAVS